MMKREKNMCRVCRVLVTSVPFIFFFAIPVFVFSNSSAPGTVGGSSKLPNPLSSINSFSDFVAEILNIVMKIGVPIAAVAIVYSGFLFLKAQGNDDELTKAKSALTWSLVGTAVLLGSWTFAESIRVTIEALR